MSQLYIVATPIGNLEDITLRALRVLKEADVIICEDTRVTKKLLDKYEIQSKRLIAYNEQRSGVSEEKILHFLTEGKNAALVSDAGTPAISDPGVRLVKAVREAGHRVIPVPGPSAVTAALSAAGVSATPCLFFGFLPHKKGRETLFKKIADTHQTVVFYESPHRIQKALTSLTILESDRTIVVARELTKIHEEVIQGTAEELLAHFADNPASVKGEFVVIVEPSH